MNRIYLFIFSFFSILSLIGMFFLPIILKKDDRNDIGLVIIIEVGSFLMLLVCMAGIVFY